MPARVERNRLLRALPAADADALLPEPHEVQLAHGAVLFEAGTLQSPPSGIAFPGDGAGPTDRAFGQPGRAVCAHSFGAEPECSSP